MEWDIKMAKARKNLDWDAQIALSIDPVRAKKMRDTLPLQNKEVCSMCGDFCSIKEMNKAIKNKSI
jgi:phosphomethylpyrimidine synthase